MSVIDISYEIEEQKGWVSEAFVEKALTAITRHLNLEGSEISCSFVSNETIQNLNKDYRNLDQVTDILSFNQSWDENFKIELESELLGDIVISLEATKQNCIDFEVDFKEELLRVLIHGVLHLTGLDHATNNNDEPMLQQQEEILVWLQKESLGEI
ncbi:MAG: rRNA maturation RNase YbeY [Sphaerochaetaceae bacterium]|jgi:probable rRNA maturation factor